jgi:hypothetical protein
MSWNKEDRSFKTLINKETTDSANKFFFNELGAKTINVHTSEIWADDIATNNPAQAVIDGVAEAYTLFALTEDLTVPNHQCWKAIQLGNRLLDWISDKYGASYTVRLFDNTGSEIFTTDPVGWFFDYQTGILTFSGDVSSKPQPFKITGYQYIGAKGGGGGGGGGTKIYTTEVGLLADVPSAGTIGYAQDTERFWLRHFMVWQQVPKTILLTRVEGPYTITVDPIAGDDGDWNDGTVTPLRTIEACIKRLPEALHQGATYYSDPPPVVKVLLKAGQHEIPAAMSSPYDPIFMDFGNVRFEGELSAPLLSFTIDHYSADDMMVWQPAGNPAWTVDEHVGKMIDVIYGSGSHYQYFIIANDTHSLTVAFPGTGYSAYFLVGSTASIVELATKWVGPRGVYSSGKQDGFVSGFFNIDFDGTVNSTSWFFDHTNGTIAFTNCLMRGSAGTILAYSEPNAQAMIFSDVMWLGCYRPIFCYGGTVTITDVIAVNTNEVVEARLGSFINVYGAMITRNSGSIFYILRGDCNCAWTFCSVMYCLNTSTIWAIEARGGLSKILCECYFTVADNKLPGNFFNLGMGAIVDLVNWPDLEASTPANTIRIDPWLIKPPGAPLVNFSYADLVNLYGGDYDYGWGTRVFT